MLAFLAFKATDQRHIIILEIYFVFYEIFVGSTSSTAPMDLKNHENQKNREKIEGLIFASSIVFHMVIAIILNFWEFIKILYVNCKDMKIELTFM